MKGQDSQYWTCQILGWGAYSSVGTAAAVIEHGWRTSIVVGYLLFFSYSIGLMHLLRRRIHRAGWMSLSISALLARLGGSSILIATIQTALVVGIYTRIEGQLGDWSEPSSIGFLFLGISFVNTIWSVLYLSLTTLRRLQQTKAIR